MARVSGGGSEFGSYLEAEIGEINMNTKLVESLADAIAALPTEDYALFQEALIPKMVKKTPGVAGGCACIRDTRIAASTERLK